MGAYFDFSAAMIPKAVEDRIAHEVRDDLGHAPGDPHSSMASGHSIS
jgi:hypothetical protein